MNGAGNRIVVVDLRGSELAISAEEVRAVHAAPGLAFDQLMAIFDSVAPGTAAFARIYNNDGGEAGACGNGTRCVAYVLMRHGAADSLAVETVAGRLACRRLGESRFEVDMGAPRLGWRDVPLAHAVEDTARVDLGSAYAAPGVPALASTASMGNPHAVIFVDDPQALDLEALGPPRERHPLFPERANISFAKVLARDAIELRVWERGVGATLACGSAACATTVAAIRAGLCDRRLRIRLPGGELAMHWRAGDDHVLMAGPVELEREFFLDAALFHGLAA